MSKTLPYYKWYPADAQTDMEYRAMSYEERGFYLSCLDLAWINEGLPTDMKELARAMNIRLDTLNRLWKRVGRKFEQSGTKLVNARQERERSEATSKSLKAAESVKVRYERSTNELPRAYVSDSVSGSVVVLDKKETSLLDDFGKFLECCETAELPASEVDRQAAKWEWGRLDFGQKLEAMKGLKDRVAAGEFSDPAFRPLPQNYLKNRIWQRPIKVSGKPKPSMDGAVAVLMRNLEIEEKIKGRKPC